MRKDLNDLNDQLLQRDQLKWQLQLGAHKIELCTKGVEENKEAIRELE